MMYSYFPAIALMVNWLLVPFVEPCSFQGPLHLGGFRVIVCMCLLCCCRWIGLSDPSHAVHFRENLREIIMYWDLGLNNSRC